MKNKKKLKYIFHNPNTDLEAANYILEIFIEANMPRVEKAINESADKLPDKYFINEVHIASQRQLNADRNKGRYINSAKDRE